MEISSISRFTIDRLNSLSDSATVAQERRLQAAVDTINNAAYLGTDNELQFSVDRDTHRPLTRIVNRETREVVRQIPAPYVLRLAAELRAQQRGKI